MEGFFLPGSVPDRRHNPGDLKHSPHSQHPDGPNKIGTIDTDEHGWEDLERQLHMYAARGMNMRELIDTYAPASENDTANYLNYVCHELHVSPGALVADVLKEQSA